MGLFDNVTIKYVLPWPEVQDATWQSKCTPAQYLNHYEIREDGTLWLRNHDRWEQVDVSGEIECHESIDHTDKPGHMWYSIQFWFKGGVIGDVIYNKTDGS